MKSFLLVAMMAFACFVRTAAADPKLLLTAEKPYVGKAAIAHLTVYLINDSTKRITLPSLENLGIDFTRTDRQGNPGVGESSAIVHDHVTPQITLQGGAIVHRDFQTAVGGSPGDQILLSVTLGTLESNELLLIRR
jgi:hypothetical protein